MKVDAIAGFFLLLLCNIGLANDSFLFWKVANDSSPFSEAYLQGSYSSDFTDRFHLSGEAGAGFFDTGSDGNFPNSEFRVDEAKLFVEAQILENIYAFSEINLTTREEEDIEIGELYIEFENISKLWNQENVLNVRAGRFDIPFGEEYQTRDVIDNPLISHSLSDIWGVDEGVELYGSSQKIEYAFAIQNGGDPKFRDFNSDKAIVGRFTFKPIPAVHFSVSAMRTGELDAAQDRFSEMWFGGGFLVLLGSPLTSTTFQGDVYEVDGHAAWKSGHVHAAGGHLKYQDNDTAEDNTRDVNFYHLELVQNFQTNHKNIWYGAARFSRIDADPDFQIVGNGDFKYLFDYFLESEFLWRFSIGAGYRYGKHLLFKVEYSFERGEQTDGTRRDQQDFFGFVVAGRF